MNKTAEVEPFKDTDYVVLMEDGQSSNGHAIVLKEHYTKHYLSNRIIAEGTYNIIKEKFNSISL